MAADASALIYLAKADAFEIVEAAGWRLLVAPAVWRESVEAWEQRGAGEVGRIIESELAGLVDRVRLNADQRKVAETIRSSRNLGSGESEAIALGQKRGRVLVDDRRAARVAVELGVAPVATLVLPVFAHRQGGLTLGAALHALRRLAVAAGARPEVLIALEERLRGDER